MSTDGDPRRVRAALARLAAANSREIVERAETAIEDLDAAAAFADSPGVEALAAAVEATDDPDLQTRGVAALSAFGRFRAAAAGEIDATADGHTVGDHFHRGRGTDLNDGDERASE